ncbi:SDR family oxidoreductase [Microbacterium rhizomatis]|nr:SDR family oxidoreductase [Microbacterium rhizomatis]
MTTASPARADMRPTALDGRTALILGAAGPHSVSAATTLAGLGAQVTVAGDMREFEEQYRGDERFQIRPFVPASVEDVAALAAAFDDTDVLVHSAGTVSTCLDAIRCFAPAMAARRRGSIIAISSPRPTCAGRGDGLSPASRQPLHQMVRSLATEMRPSGVRVNAISPQGVDPVAAIAFLASDASAHITGAVLAMEPGWSVLERPDAGHVMPARTPGVVTNLHRDGAGRAARAALSFPVRLHDDESATKGHGDERRRA